jgi:hypothetical protein
MERERLCSLCTSLRFSPAVAHRPLLGCGDVLFDDENSKLTSEDANSATLTVPVNKSMSPHKSEMIA